MDRRRVAVIGAGAGGLCAYRAFTSPASNYEVTIFEKRDRVGGIWNYDIEKGPMYRNLRTNLPKPVMSIPDFPFSPKASDVSSYPRREEVLDYLHSFCDHIGARPDIKLETEVTLVTPTAGENENANWIVRYQTSKGNEEGTFHAVVVCNGRYENPLVPHIPGMQQFHGKVIHSLDYKIPEVFSGKKVIIFGGRSSGQDLSLDIASCASQVIISHDVARIPSKLPSNLQEVYPIERYEDNGFVCQDGSVIKDVDVFVFCTGYRYSFPFLHDDCGITVNDGGSWCYPLYQHVVNANHPTMFFLGITQNTSLLQQLAIQAFYARALLDGRCSLPSTEEMIKDIKREFKERVTDTGKRPRHMHVQNEERWAYNDNLMDLSGRERLPPYVAGMFESCLELRATELTNYRNYFFEAVGENDYRVQRSESVAKTKS